MLFCALITINRRLYHRQVRVRFAPSPTGYLHLGGLRTALYNYLFARSQNGKFILRIEDTDQTRLVEGAVEKLKQDLVWAGIKIDEGPGFGGELGPYVQSQRLQIYSHHVKTLLGSTAAYHCFCSDKRLDLLRREALRAREVPKYDNRCRHKSPEEVFRRLSNGEKSCVRFKLSPGNETFDDLIYGPITYDISANEGDPVIIKSDGFPTYHFANVVDDHLMNISHVLRGVEWQISTTKHILMYRAFEWEPPQFGHLPLLMNADGTKLSKRQGDIRIGHFKESGIFPLGLINFIVHSGGGFEKDSERFLKPKCHTIDALTEQFDISRINSHSGRLMPERLLEFNRLEIKRRLLNNSEESELVDQVQDIVIKKFSDDYHCQTQVLDVSPEYVRSILKWSVGRISKLSDLVDDNLKFVWTSPANLKIDEEQIEILIIFATNFEEHLSNLKNMKDLNSFIKQFCSERRIKFGSFMKTMRSVLSGLKEGPSVAEMIEILGKDNTLKRLRVCIQNNKHK